MKTDKPTISLRILQNSHRVNVSFGSKANLFCSVKYSVFCDILRIAGFGIRLYDKIKQTKDGETIFVITVDDAARLLNKFARPIHDAHLNLAEPRLMAKWETRVQFVAGDFE